MKASVNSVSISRVWPFNRPFPGWIILKTHIRLMYSGQICLYRMTLEVQFLKARGKIGLLMVLFYFGSECFFELLNSEIILK